MEVAFNDLRSRLSRVDKRSNWLSLSESREGSFDAVDRRVLKFTSFRLSRTGIL